MYGIGYDNVLVPGIKEKYMEIRARPQDGLIFMQIRNYFIY